MEDDEERLVLLAQSGDQRAFDVLLRRYERPLYRHIYRMLGHDEACYEALQETYLVIVRNIRKLRARSNFRPWAYGVATRVCLKARSKWARRHEDAEEQLDPPDGRPAPDIVVESKEQKEELMSRIHMLSPRIRSVMLLHFYEGLTLKEVSAALEISIGTVKSRLAAGLERLRFQCDGASE